MTRATLIAVPEKYPEVTAVRSTLVQSSLNALRRRGHFESYCRLVDSHYRRTILETMAPEWLSLPLVHAHYAACSALDLPDAEIVTMGSEVSERIQGTFLATIVRTGRTAGLTPWVTLATFPRLWDRMMQGGAVGLTQVGPKDCLLEFRGLSLCTNTYFRRAFCGLVTSGIVLGGGKSVTVRLQSTTDYKQRCVMRGAWV